MTMVTLQVTSWQDEHFVAGEAQKMNDFWREQWQYFAEICENPDQSLGWEECATIFKKIAELFRTKKWLGCDCQMLMIPQF